MKRAWKIINNIITILLSILLLFMIYFVVTAKVSGGEPNFFGYQIKVVLSGSMEPNFNTGSIIAIEPLSNPTKLKKGDVITFMETENTLVTHRIIEVIKNGTQTMYRTKGDNNTTPDMNSVLSQNVVGKYTGFHIPYVGYFANYAKSKSGMALLLIIPGVLLLGYSGFTIYKTFKELDSEKRKEQKEGKKVEEPV